MAPGDLRSPPSLSSCAPPRSRRRPAMFPAVHFPCVGTPCAARAAPLGARRGACLPGPAPPLYPAGCMGPLHNGASPAVLRPVCLDGMREGRRGGAGDWPVCGDPQGDKEQWAASLRPLAPLPAYRPPRCTSASSGVTGVSRLMWSALT